MRKLTLLGALILTATTLACGAAGKKDTAGPGAQGTSDSAAPANDGKHTIKLEVSGPPAADITYGLGADTSQAGAAKLPWTKTLTSSEALIIPTVVAQSKGKGEITCRITVDGKLVKENKSTGQYAVVSCTGGP